MTIEFNAYVHSGRLWIPTKISKKENIKEGDLFRCTLVKLVLKEATA